MPALELQPFAEHHVEAAAELLAARHERHRAAEPLLPGAGDCVAHVLGEWHVDDASGAIAFAGGAPVGYLVGGRRTDAVGPFVWSYVAGHAARDPEVVRDLYRLAATRWVEEGTTRHFVYAPALPELLEPWFRLSFGASAALAARGTAGDDPGPADGIAIRRSTPDDLDAAAGFGHLLDTHLGAPPSYSGIVPPPLSDYVEDWSDTWERDEFVHFVADLDGRVAGHLLLYRRPADLRVPADAIDLAHAATDPWARGRGVARALTAHALAWARKHGHPTMTTDWRMTNLEASRFWPRRGFRETFLRLYRSIP